ncbi:MAG TPA: cytochrome c1 [Alphaproteobacteria bacterium]|nr:cytochrome c1 [Alphaproteobacteria bacterium]
MRSTLIAAAALVGVGALGVWQFSPAFGADEPSIKHLDWSFYGPFGTFDRAALQRGFQVVNEVCSNCHSFKQLHYRDLEKIGLSEAQVAALAAQTEVTDGPNDQGEMFKRPGKPSDPFKAPFPNEEAARAANNGALPPDLSLIIKAREGGPNYVYSILTGFVKAPAGFHLSAGMNYNAAFPGHQIAMPQPLQNDSVTYTDGTKASLDQEAHDVVTFLTWVANPELDERHRLGVKVLIFLVILTGLLYMVKRKVWRDVH